MTINKLFVIGSGTMGSGIAQTAVQSGLEVTMSDINETFVERGRQNIEKRINRLVEKGKFTAEERDKALNRLKTTVGMKEAETADAVIEAASEDEKIKSGIFKELDEICPPETIFASNTSSISITYLASFTKRPDRVIGMHFFNPVPIMKLLEITMGYVTSQETLSKAKKVGEKMGKVYVVAKDKAGFIVNRLLDPMLNEAVYLVDEGVATVEDIDKALVYGCNYPMGPLALTDLIGLDVLLAVMETFYKEYGDPKYRPAPLLRKMVRAGKLGKKTKEGFYKYE
ncbi:3-hydroxybutyryl-CoA dehydrogenase [Acidilutibacter cellobiosedens]|jgi:3-hydroxybutyryl-CoA dehydrogenase|uniref:3-hydroxybutyryl-CoA dehydrogenase n=1 Tax=Acidilutibacter cellobiosedens TaxID=2507161 RepID=A0A410QAQ0_9FIRM|nr:3-hydroxybutyryl-CoA dehydrogenase [Acidilutibacter cellobiosedens]QAT61073.1 3-hydroxybutyryl-CoA dehydrogenase [Acidilutibacter cellobiosedens]